MLIPLIEITYIFHGTTALAGPGSLSTEGFVTTWKGKYRSTDNTRIGKKKRNSYKKKRINLRMKGTHKHTEA